MLRDIPRIYFFMFAVVAVMIGLVVWYGNFFQRGSDTLQLNEVVQASAVEEIDQSSRMYQGALLLKDTFETNVWQRISDVYPDGADVQFDYVFNTEDPRFNNVESGERSSPTYIVGSTTDRPDALDAVYMTGRPIDYVRIKVKAPDDNVGEWTYVSTVRLDAATDVSEIVVE